MLWFAALGPVLLLAGMADGFWGARRSRRQDQRRRARHFTELRLALADAHDAERRARRAAHPDVTGFRAMGERVWRQGHGRGPGTDDLAAEVVIGQGTIASDVRLTGDATPADAAAFATEVARVSDAPVVIDGSLGIAVQGPLALATAVARGLVLQTLLRNDPRGLRLEGRGESWMEGAPHRQGGAVRAVRFDVGRCTAEATDIAVVAVGPGEDPPPRCGAVLVLEGIDRARLLMAGRDEQVRVEPIGLDLASELAGDLARRALAARPPRTALPGFREVQDGAPGGVLAAAIGWGEGGAQQVDLVADGPHAVVIGTTGSGKSELLTAWVASLSARYSADTVTFLLIDFKGGRTFDSLMVLPHVVGVVTDLDEPAMMRAVESLRAEVRHRERVLAAAGAREIDETAGVLPRLVVVVDEYAALVAAHPVVHEVFADLAARGRALGIHVILASQRATGIFRDAVMANAPLRLAMRVEDRSDSRTVLGVDDAALLSGAPEERGVALVRGPADAVPRRLRIVRCLPDDLAAISSGARRVSVRRPWLPPLSTCLLSADLTEEQRAATAGTLVGVADIPEEQAQPARALASDDPGIAVIGAPGSGKSAVLRALAHARRECLLISSEPETGWDALDAAAMAPPGTLVLADDVDLLCARLPVEYASAARDRLERLVREARSRRIQVAVSLQRAVGGLSRVIDGLPTRFLLAQPTREDFAAAGGNPAQWERFPPGRGRWTGAQGSHVVQAVWEPPGEEAVPTAPTTWRPGRLPGAWVAPDTARARAIAGEWGARDIRGLGADTAAVPWAAGDILWGTPDAWLADWRRWATARAHAEILIDTACAAEYRTLTGRRDLPPYAEPHGDRAWLLRGEEEVRRVRIGAREGRGRRG